MRRLFIATLFVLPLSAGLLAWLLWPRDPLARELEALPHVEGLTEAEVDAFRLKAEALAEAEGEEIQGRPVIQVEGGREG